MSIYIMQKLIEVKFSENYDVKFKKLQETQISAYFILYI